MNWMAGHDVARVMAYCFEAFPPADDDAAATEGAGGRRYAMVKGGKLKRTKPKAMHGPSLTELRGMGSTYKTFQKRCWAWLKETHPRVGMKTGSKIVGDQWQRRKVQMGRPSTKKSAARRRKKTKKARQLAVRTAGSKTWQLVEVDDDDDDDWKEVMVDEWIPRFDVALRDSSGFAIGPFRYTVDTDYSALKRYSRPVAGLLLDLGYGRNDSLIEVIIGTWEDDYDISLKEVRTVVGVNERTGRRFVESFVEDTAGRWYHSGMLTLEIKNYLGL